MIGSRLPDRRAFVLNEEESGVISAGLNLKHLLIPYRGALHKV